MAPNILEDAKEEESMGSQIVSNTNNVIYQSIAGKTENSDKILDKSEPLISKSTKI